MQAILNPKQARLYSKHSKRVCGVHIDPICKYDAVDEVFVYWFPRKHTYELYQKWNAHELD